MQKQLSRVSKPVSLLFRILRSKLPKSRLTCWHCARKLGEAVTIHTLQGLLSIRTDDGVIGKCLFLEGQYELDLTRKVKQLLESLGYGANGKNRILIDVGANIGVISIGLMQDGFFSKAVAVEPEPVNYSLLTENIRLNGFQEKIHAYQNALSSAKGEVEFELSDDNYGDHRVRTQGAKASVAALMGEQNRRTIKIPSLTLDSIVSTNDADNINNSPLLWIDVQGYEGYVFQGGKEFLGKGIPTVAEIWPYGILRSGMSLQIFTEIVSGYWLDYWVLRKRGFVKYPIDTFPLFLHELGEDGEYDNVIFTRTSKDGKLLNDLTKI